MKDKEKTKQQLIDELVELHRRIAELEKSEKGRRQAEEALQVSETRYRGLFETARDGILQLDEDTGKITDVNPFLIDMLGYSHEELLGKKLWDIGLFKDIVPSKAAFLDLQTRGYVRYEDLPLETKDGRSIDVEFVSNVYLVNHNKIIQCNIRDITRRRQAESVSREARRFAESLIDTVREPFVVLDKDLIVLSANRSFYSTFEVTPGETVGNLIYDIGNRQWDIPPLRKLLEDILPKNTQFNNYEVSHKFQTIGQKIMLLNARQIYQEVIGIPMILLAIEDITEKRRMEDKLRNYREHLEQQIEERTAELKTANEQLLQDITERKRTEEELRKVNRAYKTSSQCNQTLIRATKESELLHEICRVVVETGGYRLAWVGFAEQDEEKTVRPAAQAGYEEGYLENVNITWADNERGRGPTGTAIRTGKPVIAKNILSDKNYIPWRAEAIRRGHASSISLPLTADGKPFGALSIYAIEPDAFDEEEIYLLTELADDLAYGITALRQHAGRKKAEEALQESEEKYRALMDNAGDAIILMDMQGNLLEINRKTESLLGRMNQEVFNKHFSQFILKNDLNRTIAAFEDLIRNGSNVLNDVNLLKKDGTPVPVDITSSIIQYGDKKVAQVIFRDITERKKAEATLRESEERYRRLVEFSPYGIAIHSEGEIVYMNQEGAKILGTENPDEFIGKPLLDIVHPDYHEIARQRIRMEEEGNVAPLIEEKFQRLDGTPVDVEIIAIPFTHKGKPSMYGVFRDITERKQAEEMQRKLSSAVEHTADIVIIARKDGTIEYVNPAFEKITGYTMEEAVGKTPRILKSGKHDLKFYEHLWGTILSGEVFYGVLINKKRNGELYYTEKTITPVKDEHGIITHFVSTDKDITERQKAEEIHHENLRLEAADKAKSEFLANMSHELRTPLNASIGFSTLLKQGVAGELSEKQKHYADNILASNQFLLTLINDILDLSKIEAGKIELVIENMSVPATIKETLSLIKEKASKHNVLLKTEFDPELEFIEADKQRFKQILFNLLSNAVKFSKEEGGTVTIRAKKEDDMVKISVSDTGIGIKEENIGRLFRKFEQLDSGISRKYGGTGLGLSITKQLVELHGGKIRAESKYGEGSTFTFMLPLQANNEKNIKKFNSPGRIRTVVSGSKGQKD